jgi:hypothetical protein
MRAASNQTLPMKQASSPTAAPEAPHGHQALSAYIRARFDEFSRSQKDVAQYIVDHLDEAAFQTAEELARRASTSSSTVVGSRRRSASRASPSCSRRRATSTAAGRRRRGGDRRGAAVLARPHRVRGGARRRPRQRRGHRAQACALRRRGGDRRDRLRREGADRRHRPDGVLRQLPAPPADAARPRAEIVASPSQEALGRLSRIDETTLVIGLSAGRPHPLITRTMKLARHRKAPTLAITDATLSEVARLARIRLYYSSNTPAFVRSHTALLSIIQALAYGVYSRDAQQYDVRIKAFRLK